ncbi:MAG: tRNA (N(6)-L-threonylcarbamoyladenosine(37)-C(2))-methylthiotransferase MtaB [Deltaproteobacteria bacterium]|nr:tRNA (N(6)-L-threonylcarbamoyladenosine(37)-C(2))-methylthiotransferase MtaB [Deltaproteobacteria bacterium]
MDVFLTTLGCRLNEAEVETWIRQLEGQGHRVVGAPESAELMVVNTCAVTSEASRKSRKFVGGLHRRNPEAKLVVTGCYSQLEPDKAAAQAGVDLVVGNADKERLIELVKDRVNLEVMPSQAQDLEHHAFQGTRTRAFIKVQDGCRNRCTFCIVTIARGNERSRSIDELVAEVELLVNRGYQEVVLTGVHLGGYGSDLGTDLVALVKAILARTEVKRLRLSSLEPWDLPDDFWQLWDDPRLMPHLHLPLQSGSDAVLKRMARRCPTDRYRQLVHGLRARIPDLVLTTDLIVGFPGETDDEHRQSLQFAREIGFAHMHIFSYSRREGTTAARMPGHLPNDVKRARSHQMHELARAMRSEHLARFAGTTREVLWEGEGELTPSGTRAHFGYTDNYLRVRTEIPVELASIENRVTETRLEVPPEGDSRHLVGEIV